MKTILALDLGSKTGWCLGDEMPRLTVKTIQLEKPSLLKKLGKKLRAYDPRVQHLYELIVREPRQIDQVVFEDVSFASTTYQAQLWASFRAAMWLAVFERHGANAPPNLHPVPVGTLKKFATGSGAADKDAMKQAGMKIAPKLLAGLDDNAIDAFHLWCYANTELR